MAMNKEEIIKDVHENVDLLLWISFDIIFRESLMYVNFKVSWPDSDAFLPESSKNSSNGRLISRYHGIEVACT